MAVLEKCKLFLVSTSAKGVSRIVKTESVGFKLYWAVCTALVFGYGFYGVGSLLMRYFSYDNVVKVEEDRLNTSVLTKYPAITICDKTPLPVSKQLPSTNSSSTSHFQEYVNKVMVMTSDVDADDVTREDLLSIKAYFQSMTQTEVDLVSQDVHSFVTDCKILYYGLGKGPFKTDCGHVIAIEKHVIPAYLNCYQFSFTGNNTGVSPADAMLGIEVTLFLDRYIPWLPTPIHYYNNNERLESGVRATLHYPGKQYFTVADSVDAAPGTSTTISLIHKERTRLSHPYSGCVQSDMYGTNVSFNPQVACIVHCLELEIADGCECIAVNDSPLQETPKNNYSFCEDISLGLAKIKSNRDCVEITRLKSLAFCSRDVCQAPCHENTWVRTTHSSKWPNLHQIHAFLASVLKNEHFSYQLDLSSSDFTVLRDFVENNFLQIRYSLDDDRYLSINDRPAMTSVDLFSAIGGTLNLWTGITVFLFIEILELILHMCREMGRSKVDPKREQSDNLTTGGKERASSEIDRRVSPAKEPEHLMIHVKERIAEESSRQRNKLTKNWTENSCQGHM